MSQFHKSPNIYVNQVALKVMDLDTSIEFYEKIMGLKTMERIARKAILSADGISPLLILEQPENIKPKELRRTGLYHFALLLPTRKDLGSFLRHIKNIGYPLMGASHHGISEAIYLHDIDDNGIEVYADTPNSRWKWHNDTLEMTTTRLDLQSLIDEGKDEVWKGIPKNTIIGHIHLHVSNLEESEKFYIDGLGFQVVTRIPRQATFISTGDYHHHIAFNVWNGIGIAPPPKDRVGMKYFTLKFPDEKTRDETINNLKELGYKIKLEDESIITLDPSKNEIHLVI